MMMKISVSFIGGHYTLNQLNMVPTYASFPFKKKGLSGLSSALGFCAIIHHFRPELIGQALPKTIYVEQIDVQSQINQPKELPTTGHFCILPT